MIYAILVWAVFGYLIVATACFLYWICKEFMLGRAKSSAKDSVLD